jgi:hypothetical protein
MEHQKPERVIHSYDTEQHRTLCGFPGLTSSSKHAAAVTCVTCRELLRRVPAEAAPTAGADDGR